MQVSVETTQGLERKMTVAVPGDQVDSAVNARLQEAARTVRMNGFRKGKVPLKVIKNRFGAGVRQEVVSEVMSRVYYEAINEQSLRPAGQPTIEPKNMNEGEDLEFVATFEVYPDINLPEFSKFEVKQLVAEVTDDDIDEMIETLRKQRQTWGDVERAAQGGDMVNIDYKGLLDGEAFEGGTAQGSSLVLGSERMIPGFEEGIEGKSAGDEFTLDLAFPDEYHNADLAGKNVQFEIKLNSVKEQQLPDIDEEFYKSFGVEEGGEDAFRKEVAGNMKRELKSASRNKVKNAVMDQVIDAVDVEIPAALIDNEINQLRAQAMQQFGGQQVDPSLLPNELFSEQASRRVVLGLVLGEVIRDQNLQADASRVRESVEELASTYESPEEVIKWYYSNQEQLDAIESSVLEDQVFDHILDQATVTEVEVSYQEVIKPEEKPEPAADQGDEAETESSAG